ncbi:MAG: RNase P subunit p30 family protein [Candidatus Woesearchaeota archaeon]
MIDIVFPENNENEFFEMAKKLGYKGLVLVYPSKPGKASAPAGMKAMAAVLADPKKAFQFRSKGILTFVQCSDSDRQVLEQGSADVLFGAEGTQPKDYAHQRGSGLNHIMCGLAKKKNVAIGFSFASILSASGAQRSQLIGRMMQNIMLCRKYKVKMIAASFAKNPWQMRQPHDLASFLTVLGMHPDEAKKALSGIPL